MKTYAYQNSRIRLTKIHYIIFVILFSISPTIAQEDTIEVINGWNMVGSLYNGPALDIIRTEPAGIIVSQYFGYNPGVGYEAKDTLKKGHGYWVKVSGDGILIFRSTAEWVCGNTLEYSGKTYNTVLVGSQCWMKENLDVGTMILATDTSKDNAIIEKYCYNDSIENCYVYGGLYQWDEAMQYSTLEGARGICPDGFHVPTLSEFQALSTTVGDDGNALKEIGQGAGGGAGTNTSGFSALLAGDRSDHGYFSDLANDAFFWSSTEYSSDYANYKGLDYSTNFFYPGYAGRRFGFSVRCLKD